ncbi:MAG: hypothetical protein OdinLCB4_002245 [Candidatus Odinarchaeum yellowstonii]|uniref:Molybdopterin dinucleotide-binding domain-containing protein n=1 Tax=Odinarchaeota yellowstonii (strain LCB_4) TaxID=1841599 RepID=A0AAF0IBH5_ODILC|nr:MAG: hypothetical protein OdinLCB4_002245 [Candidatus Odinarchaeum yellowstonii]
MKAILITGRSVRQGELIEGLKHLMKSELGFCDLNPEDASKLCLKNGDKIVLRRDGREIFLKTRFNASIPPGVIYVEVHSEVNKLIPYSKSRRGMMPGKGVEVEVEKFLEI